MFVAWSNLILFLRRMPRMGIYIVMVGEVLTTFMQFFFFCFSFFLFSFGFTFYVLLGKDVSFLFLNLPLIHTIPVLTNPLCGSSACCRLGANTFSMRVCVRNGDLLEGGGESPLLEIYQQSMLSCKSQWCSPHPIGQITEPSHQAKSASFLSANLAWWNRGLSRRPCCFFHFRSNFPRFSTLAPKLA